MMASVALTMALGALGRGDDLTTVAQAALDRAITSFQASHMRFWFGQRLRPGMQTDRPDRQNASRWLQRLADSAREAPSLAYANLASLDGHVAELMRGERAEPRVEAPARSAAPVSKGYGVRTGLRPATCFSACRGARETRRGGGREEGDRRGAVLCSARLPVHADRAEHCHGWSLAANGCVNEAIATVQSAAAAGARTRTSRPHELACLQVAAQWGDASGAVRAASSPTSSSCRSPTAVARHTESLAANDGEGLLAASADYQAIGDWCHRGRRRRAGGRGLHRKSAAQARSLGGRGGQGTQRRVRWAVHAGVAQPGGPAVDRTSTRDRGTRRGGPVQPSDRRPAGDVRAQRRGPRLSRLPTGRGQLPRGTGARRPDGSGARRGVREPRYFDFRGIYPFGLRPDGSVGELPRR